MVKRGQGSGPVRLAGWAALALGLLGPALILVGALGTKLGAWDYTVGLGKFVRDWSVPAAMAGAGLGALVALAAAVLDRRALIPTLVGLAAAGGTLYALNQFRATARANPIHDIATDWSEPLIFSAAMMAERRRTGAKNPVEPDPVLEQGGTTRRVAEIGREICPAATPVARAVTPDEAAAALESAGVRITLREPGRVEGTHESFWFGFEDDVVVRLRPDRADVRSISRVGGSDLGANCARVTKIVEALRG